MYDWTKQLASIHTRPVGTTRPDMTRIAGRDPLNVRSNESTRADMPRRPSRDQPQVTTDDSMHPDAGRRGRRDSLHVRPDGTTRTDLARRAGRDPSHATSGDKIRQDNNCPMSFNPRPCARHEMISHSGHPSLCTTNIVSVAISCSSCVRTLFFGRIDTYARLDCSVLCRHYGHRAWTRKCVRL